MSGADSGNGNICPGDGRECQEVSVKTILHHIREPWTWIPGASRYYFCSNPDCEVAYFGEDGTVFERSEIRTSFAAKDGSGLVCHCFGVSREDFDRNPATKDFVVEQTRRGMCSCQTSNPSGRCCLKDFPEHGD